MIRNNGDEGYKFIIVVLAGTISFLYTLLNYIQSKAFNEYEYKILCAFISFSLILIVTFFVYFIIKGISMEIRGESHEKLITVASKIYSINFLMLSTFLILMISSYILFLFYVNKHYILAIIFFIVAVIFVYWGNPKLNKITKELNLSNDKFLISIFIIIFFWGILFFYVGQYSHLGSIEIDMDKIYYKNNEPIPVLIKLTGPDSHLSVILFKEESNDLIPLWEIENLGQNYGTSVKTNCWCDDYVLASSLGNGKYTIYINTANLTLGYYQLKCSRQNYKGSSDSGFYLLDNKNES